MLILNFSLVSRLEEPCFGQSSKLASNAGYTQLCFKITQESLASESQKSLQLSNFHSRSMSFYEANEELEETLVLSERILG